MMAGLIHPLNTGITIQQRGHIHGRERKIVANTDPQDVWTNGTDEFGEDGSPVCKYTRVDLVAVDAGDPGAPEHLNGNNARPSALPAGQFGALTGYYPDKNIGYLTQKGAEQLMAEYVWDPELAAVTTLTYDEWAQPVVYALSDIVQHLGMVYIVIQPHTSQAGWEPPNVPALFNPYDPSYTVQPWVQPISTNPYGMDAQVTHNGSTWTSFNAANVWEPGVSQWTEMVDPNDGQWHTGINYVATDARAYDGVDYVCLSPHMSQSDWTPPRTIGNLWAVAV